MVGNLSVRVPLAALLFLWALGIQLGMFAAHVNAGHLPKCQEDEYLYPTKDYKGPGKNALGDYQCVPFDGR